MKTIKKIIQKIIGPKVEYQPLIEVRIFKNALLHNLGEYQKKYSAVKFAPVLKSNAYGHGLVEVAEILDNQNLPFFMVDSFYEALTLRLAGIKTKILILGYCRQKQLLENSLKNISFGIMDLEVLKKLSSAALKKINIHLKIDTGMHRQGILLGQVDEAMRLIKSNKNLILEGVCSHFADADGPDPSFTQSQIETWNKAVKIFKQNFPEVKYYHFANTAGTHYSKEIDANVCKAGIGLYGINTSTFEEMDLRPVLEMVSVISSVKSIKAGDKVGYNVTYEAKNPTVVATVPVGYNEGVDRRLSNKGSYKVGRVFCPLAGRVSMNMTSIDVSAVAGIKIEDEVTVISGKKTDQNSVENIAKLCDCIPYEVLVHIPSHLRRRII